jgi:hypothetical protein
VSGAVQQAGTVLYTSRVGDIERLLTDEIERRVHQCVEVVRTETLKVLSGSRSGRWYAIPGTKSRYRNARQQIVRSRAKSDTGRAHLKRYQASAPGEAPATRLGGLRQSMRTLLEADARAVTGFVGSDLPYSVYMEKGTKRIRPRPFLSRAFASTRGEIRAILSRRLELG